MVKATWEKKLKVLGVDRSKFLSGQQLRERLDIKTMTMYRWQRVDPAFPKMHRPFGKGGYPVTLYSIRDVEEYERVLAERRESIIKNILSGVERELRGDECLCMSRVIKVMSSSNILPRAHDTKMLPFLGSTARWKDNRKD